MSKRSSIYTGTIQWIHKHYRDIKHLPGEDEEPFTREDLDERVLEHFPKLTSENILTKKDYDYDNGSKRWNWVVSPEARAKLEEIADSREKAREDGDTDNPLPCDCLGLAISNHRDGGIECRKCNQTWTREEIDAHRRQTSDGGDPTETGTDDSPTPDSDSNPCSDQTPQTQPHAQNS